MPIQAIALTLLLFSSPPSEDPQGYADSLAEVEALDAKINVGEAVPSELDDALSNLTRFAPALAADPEARAARSHAQLNLARSYLANDELDKAVEILDDVIRSSFGEPLDVGNFGPSLADLYAQRLTELQALGTGGIEVTCTVPCRVYVNEAPAEQKVESLYLGTYRIWVEATEGELAGKHTLEPVKLEQPGTFVRVDFNPIPPPKIDPKPSLPPPPDRVMPRSPEVALMVIGVAAATGGALLLGLGSEYSPGRIGAGATLLALGGATLIVGSVTLAVDEVRLGKWRGRQAMVSWSMSF